MVSGHAGGVVSGDGGISGRGVGGMVGAGGIGSPFEAPTQQFSPRKRNPVEAFEEHPTRTVDSYLPLAESAYMDYTRHVDAGLAGKVWRRQGREWDRIKRTINLAGNKSKYTAAVVIVGNEDGRGTEDMTGLLTPDLTLGLG